MDFTGVGDLIPSTTPQDVVDTVFELVPAASAGIIQVAILASVIGALFGLLWKGLRKIRSSTR